MVTQTKYFLLYVCAGGNMWISADESEVVSATLLPKLKKTWRAHEDLLFEAVTLQVNFTSDRFSAVPKASPSMSTTT